MSNDDCMADVIETGMVLRRMDFEDGRKAEREQIIAALGQYFGNTTACREKTITIKLGELLALIERRTKK
jgi:hypothetical protein